MGIDKQSSKHGNYVGGFLQLFDWNAKSRKKLFSSKTDFPEKTKQKKRFDGNLPRTRLQMLDEDEFVAGSSMKGSSDYSCASSVTDEDFCGTRAPGVVARLMGLDSLPKSNTCEPNSTPLFDCQSLPGAYYQTENLEYRQDSQIIHSSSLHEVTFRNDRDPRLQKVIHRPLDKFQTETLPPKTAKAIPITCHKLLSPIKSANVIPPEDAAHIMEAAARIIEPRPQASVKTRLPLTDSSSVPLKARDFKEKVQAIQKAAKLSEGYQRPGESSAVKHLRGNSINKSWNSPVDATPLRIFQDSEESSVGLKSKQKSVSLAVQKSVSLAVQAKANVQKREGLNLNSSRPVVSLKETSEASPNQPFKSQAVVQKSVLKKPSTQNCSVVLRQNNQKQNSNVDRGKLLPKPKLQGGKELTGDSSSASQRNSSKLVGTSKASSRKLGSEVKDDKRQLLPSSLERVTRKKRPIHRKYNSEKIHVADIQKEKNEKVTHTRSGMDMPSSRRDLESGTVGTDVISFTFTAPITRSGLGSGRYNEGGENCEILSADSQNKKMLLNSDGISDPKLSFLGNNVKGGDTLSTILDQKLKELHRKVELSEQKLETSLNGMEPGLSALMSSTMQEDNKSKGGNYARNQEGQPHSSLYSLRDTKGFITDQTCQHLVEEIEMHGRDISEDRKLLDCHPPGAGSVLEHSSFAGSCISTDTADSSAGGSKQCSTVEYQDTLSGYSINAFIPFEREADLSDSASSSAGTEAKRQEAASTLPCGKPRNWELEYVKDILYNIEMMFKNYALGRACEVINPYLYDQLESRTGGYLSACGVTNKINRRLVFDCASECLELRCKHYVGGGCKLWAKGLRVVKGKDRLAEDVYKDISAWSAMGDFMVDELVDNDMSSQYGKWLNFDIEAFELGVQIESRILNSLIDEVVSDILVL